MVRKINNLAKKKATASSGGAVLKRYSRLIRSFSQKDTKVVVSLGSGGIRMFAHVPVLRFLEKLGAQKHIAEIWGSSGGAIVGLLFAMGLSSDEILKESEAYFKVHQLKLTPSIYSVAKSVFRDAFSSSKGPRVLKGFHSIQQSLRDLVSRTLETCKEKYPLYCLAYNLENNRTEVLTPTEFPEGVYPDFIFRTDPLDAIIASSSVPVVFVPKEIQYASGKRTYTDGGAGEEIPTVSIYKKWLHDRELGLEKKKRLLVIAVDLGNDFSTMSFFDGWMARKIPALEYLRMTIHLTDLVRRARIAEQKRVLMNDPNVELWEVNVQLAGVGFLDVEAISDVLKAADASVPLEFDKLNDAMLI